jgi:hypothetical protein
VTHYAWIHRGECTETRCVCADADDPDPICAECGFPGWACQCHEECDDAAEDE